MVEIYYAGQRMTVKGDIAIALITIDHVNKIIDETNITGAYIPETINSNCSLFKATKGANRHTIGCIYEVDGTTDENGRITQIKGPLKFKRASNPSCRGDWIARDNEVTVEIKRKQMEAKAEQNLYIERAIQTLRDARKDTAPAHRRSFTNWLISELMR